MLTFFLGVSTLYILLDILLLGLLIGLAAFDGFPFALGIVGAIVPGIIYWYSGINVYAWFIANPLLGAGIVLAYILIGVAWSILAWFLFVRENSDAIQTAFDEYKNRVKSSTKTPEEIKEAFLANSVYNPLYRKGYSLSNPHNFKIINWIVLWPFSIIWKVIRSFTIDFSKLVLRLFGRIYDGISASVISKLN